MDLKQPVLGIASTGIVIAISFVLISLFDFPTFTGWVSVGIMCIIPMEIVVGVVWGTELPAFAAMRPQPLKGLLLALITVVSGLVFGLAYFQIAGGGVSPPAPMLTQAVIVSVVMTFWTTIIFGGWPFTLIQNKVTAGLMLLTAVYVINYLLFQLFFNYEFMAEAPVYVASLDPGGLFNAWNALVFYVTALSFMFLLLNFDLWPLTGSPGVMKQPVLGIVWTLVCLALACVAFYVGVVAMGVDVVHFLVTVPIPFIFGTIIVLNMLQGSLTARMTQPTKGIVNVLAALVVGVGLSRMYEVMAPVLTGSLDAGPPEYQSEIWLASALLAITFPFLVFHAEFFAFWPLKKG